MNRYAKGAIAAGAATVLLLGGLGTFALWNDSQSIDAGSVATGQLALDTDDMTGQWYRYVDGEDDPTYYVEEESPIDEATFKVVPGDELIFVATDLKVTADGDEIYFTVAGTLGTPDPLAPQGFTVGDPQLFGDDEIDSAANGSTVEYTFAAVDPGTTVYGLVGNVGVKTETFDVTMRLSFDADDLDDQDVSIDLSDAAIEIQQVVKA